MAEPVGPVGPVIGRRWVLGALLAAGGSAVAGCARIPTSGRVRSAEGGARVERRPRLFARLPRLGAPPRDIVEGFLQAGAIGDGSFAEARAYLAGRDVAWEPDTGVVVHAGRKVSVVAGPGAPADAPATTRPTSTDTAAAAPTSGSASGSASGPTSRSRVSQPAAPTSATPAASVPPPRDGARAEVVVAVAAVAVLDGDGRMTVLAGPEQRSRTFGLVARSGQWRIDRLEDGVLMGRDEFYVSAYGALSVYFPDVTGTWLVPDVRYIRQAPDSTSTQTDVVSAVLAGPSGWLSGALVPFTNGLQLRVSAVPVSAGVATVDLTDAAASIDQRSLALLGTQLRESLGGLAVPQVYDVELTVGGQRLRGSGSAATGGAAGGPGGPAGGQQPVPAARASAGSTYVAMDAKARVVTVTGAQVRVVERLTLVGGTRPAMTYGTTDPTFAALVRGRTTTALEVATVGGPVVEIVSGADFTAPSFDSAGWVWTSPRRPSGRVVAGRTAGSGRADRIDVEAAWLAAGEVVSLRLSREGARAVLVVDVVAADGRRSSALLLAGVRRSTAATPISLGEPVRLLPDLDRASDAVWLDDTHVVVLGNRRSGAAVLPVQPWVVDIGGDPSVRGVSSTAALGTILTVDGRDVSAASPWQRLPLEVSPTIAVGDSLDAVYVSTAKGDLFHFRQSGSWERGKAVVRPSFPG